MKPAEGEKLVGWKFTPTADRLFLAVSTAKDVRVRALETATGKSVWGRVIDFDAVPRAAAPKSAGNPRPQFPAQYEELLAQWKLAVRVSFVPSGKWLGVTVTRDGSVPSDYTATSVCLLLDVATGKDGTPLSDLGKDGNQLHTISADGSLAVGETGVLGTMNSRTGRNPGTRQLVAWHTGTGKVLKSWPTSNQLSAAFSPKAPLLAVIDRRTILSGTGTDKTVSTTSTLGFWDLSGLLK